MAHELPRCGCRFARMRNFIYLAFVLAACSKSSASEPPASKTAEPKVAEAPAVAPPVAAPAEPACVDGQTVTERHWMYGDAEPYLFIATCTNGVSSYSMKHADDPPYGYAVKPATWE